MPKVDLTCENCGEEFQTYKSPSNLRKTENFFCSRGCVNEFQKKNFRGENNPNYEHGKREKIKQTCEECGETFFSFREEKFCSQSCANTRENNAMWKGGKVAVECDWCGKKLERWPSNLSDSGHTFCSEHQGKQNILYYSGKDSACWNGGTDDYYFSSKWKTIRNQIKDFFGYKCRRCGKEKNTVVHHIIPRKKRKENLTMMHFLVLCRSCHNKIEGLNIEEQFNSVFGDIHG